MDFPVFDADGHIYENEPEIEAYFEGPYRGLRRSKSFSLFPSLDGWPRGFLLEGAEKVIETPAEVWLAFLDRAGIEAAVLYPSAGLAIGLIQDPGWARALARAYNNWLFDRFCRVSPRLKGVALLPIQDGQASVLELRRAVTEQGMVGGLLPSVTALHKGYGHRDFYPIFEEAQRLDRPLAIHGGTSHGLGFDFVNTMAMIHALEHPIGLMIQITSIVLNGVLEDFPRLRLAFLEAGAGWVPYMMDRLDEKYRGDRRRRHIPLKRLPSEYIRSGNVYFTCELEEKILDTVVRELGEDVLMYPSDFPHEKAREEFSTDIPEFLERSDMTATAKRKILYDNAKRFYRLG